MLEIDRVDCPKNSKKRGNYLSHLHKLPSKVDGHERIGGQGRRDQGHEGEEGGDGRQEEQAEPRGERHFEFFIFFSLGLASCEFLVIFFFFNPGLFSREQTRRNGLARSHCSLPFSRNCT